tara:strand:+ start:1060 stop:1380 length:321 start_codon:yes stop_codon:yes gene_type:complete
MSVYNWNNADFNWNDNPYTWDEVLLVIEAIRPGDGVDLVDLTFQDWNDDDEKRKKRFIKLILKIHGDTITESKKKEIKQYKIKASDIKLTVEKVLGVEILTENIKF